MKLLSLINQQCLSPDRSSCLKLTIVSALVCTSCAAPEISQKALTDIKGDNQAAIAEEQPKHRPVMQGGMVIYIDPKTGALLQEPAPGAVMMEFSPAMRNAMSTSSEGLVERESPVPGGGMIVDLQGRFQSPLIATVDADGKVKMHHPTELGAQPHLHTNKQAGGKNHDH